VEDSNHDRVPIRNAFPTAGCTPADIVLDKGGFTHHPYEDTPTARTPDNLHEFRRSAAATFSSRARWNPWPLVGATRVLKYKAPIAFTSPL
jgi:hypothetical protein